MLPTELLAHIETMEEADGDHLVLNVPSGWVPSSEALPLSSIATAVRAGIGLDLTDSGVFDLRVLGDILPFITRLRMDAVPASMTGLDAIQSMGRLQWLWAPRIDEPIDLSGLRSLEEITMTGPGLLSALRTPRLRRATVDLQGSDTDFAVPPTVEDFSFSGRSLAAAHLASATSLRRLWLTEISEIDLSGIRNPTGLEVVSVMAAERFHGLDDLLRGAALTELTLVRVKRVVPADALMEASVGRLYVDGCPDFQAPLANHLIRDGWHVKPMKVRGRPRSAFYIERLADREYEVVFDDWSVLAERLGLPFDSPLPIDSGDIEDALRRQMAGDLSQVATSDMEFDSEGDAVRVIVHSRKAAEMVRRVGNHLLRDGEAVRELVAASDGTGRGHGGAARG